MKLSERDRKVLEAVITDYVESGEPVGSRTIARRYGLSVSSATIRNVMADLEEVGLLTQPHTSAGRVPTEKGLRVYIDSIMQLKELESGERERIREAFRDARGDTAELLRRSSRVLSSISRQAGLVLRPRLSASRFKHIEFVALKPGVILTVLISRSGIVHHTVVEWEEEVDQRDLDKYGAELNELLQDVPLSQARERILEEMRREKALFDQLFARVLSLSQRALESTAETSDVYIEGQTNLLRSPEFADVERMRRILEAFEDRSRIVRLLDRALLAPNRVQVILGPEGDLQELGEVGLVSSVYGSGGTALGVLGVIGPRRMDYSRIVPVVEFTARMLSELLEEPEAP